MGGVLGPLIVEKLDDGRLWRVQEAFRYYLIWPPPPNDPEFVDVPAGFLTDFGSIPSIVPPFLVNRTGRLGKAFVIHDKLYRAPVIRIGDRSARAIDRDEADAIMAGVGRACRAPRIEVALAYAGVRIGGHWAWEHCRREEFRP